MFFKKISPQSNVDQIVGEVSISPQKSFITYDSTVNTCDAGCPSQSIAWTCTGTCQTCGDTCACRAPEEGEVSEYSPSSPRP